MNIAEQLERDEGFSPKPYRDTVSKLTIGYGRNLDDVGVSRAEARFMMLNDLAEANSLLKKAFPWFEKLDNARQGVLLNMTFNMGLNKLLEFKKTIAHIEAGEYEAAAVQMLVSKWATQVGPRATRLAKQMKTGEWQ